MLAPATRRQYLAAVSCVLRVIVRRGWQLIELLDTAGPALGRCNRGDRVRSCVDNKKSLKHKINPSFEVGAIALIVGGSESCWRLVKMADFSSTQAQTYSPDAVTVFSFAWAAQSLAHLAFFDHWISSVNPLAWILLVLGFAVLLFPGRLRLFMAMMVADMT